MWMPGVRIPPLQPGPRSSDGRAIVFYAIGRGFDPLRGCQEKDRKETHENHGSVAQMAVQLALNQTVGGSSPLRPTTEKEMKNIYVNEAAILEALRLKPSRDLNSGTVAQQAEQSAFNRTVVGSIPSGPTKEKKN